MAHDPYITRTAEEKEKDLIPAKRTLLEMVARAPQHMLDCFSRLGSFAKSQGISSEQALDEAVMALPRRFPEGLSNLTDWIPRCQEMGIPHIPIVVGPSISVSDLEKIADDRLPASPHLDEISQFIADAYSRGHMWRWDACGPEPLKLLAGLRRTEPQHQGLPVIPLTLDDRLFHILWDDQAVTTRVVSRPWTMSQMDEGFSVEFRVFKTPAGEAACNYYPQRELSKAYLPKMEEAVALTRQLAKATNRPQEFSCDWLLTPEGEVLFLEGGPGHLPHGGAHPCCFAGLKTTPGRRLLKSEPGAQFYIEPKQEKILADYTKGNLDFSQAIKALGLPPKVGASLFAIKGIIPREMAEKVIAG